MTRLKKIKSIRSKLRLGKLSLGSWMQIPNSSVAEIMGFSGYDWIAIDLEHGSISIDTLPDLFRAIELGGSLPLVRLAQANAKDCKQALDAGAGGVIVPMIESAEQLKFIKAQSSWPPIGARGVAYTRANLFGGTFKDYMKEAQSPLIIAMIETKQGLENLEEILEVKGLDAIMIGPYDLSASIGKTGDFKSMKYLDAMRMILDFAKSKNVPCGIHIVEPSETELKKRVKEGFRFIAYSMDSVMLRNSAKLKISE